MEVPTEEKRESVPSDVEREKFEDETVMDAPPTEPLDTEADVLLAPAEGAKPEMKAPKKSVSRYFKCCSK